MKKDDKAQVSGDAPKLVLENEVQITTDAVVNDVSETQAAEENKPLVWIRVLLPLAGKFLLPHDPGAEIEIDSNQAEAIVEAGYGEYIENSEVE